MSNRDRIRKNADRKSNSLPNTNFLQTRPFTPPRKLAKPLTREEIQAILPKLEQFGYNGAKIPVFPPDPTLSSPIQSTSGDSQVQDNSQQQPEILQPSEELAENEEISTEAENIQRDDLGEVISEDEEKETNPEQLTELESTDNPETQSQEKLDLQAKFSKLEQFGYNGAKIPVFPPNPDSQIAIGSKSGVSQVENNYQEKPQELQSDEAEKENEQISTEGENIQFGGGVSGDEDKVGESKDKYEEETDTITPNLVDKISAPTAEELVQEKPNPKEEENNKTESDPNLNTKAVSSTSDAKPETLINNSYDPTLIAYGSETEQTFDGGTAKLNTFGEINRQMIAIWRLTSNNNEDDRLTEVNLNFSFSNNENKTIQPEIPTPSQVVRGRLSVEFGPFNGLTLSGRRGTVIMSGTARSFAHNKYIPNIESTCELYDSDVLPESAKETIGRASVEGKLYTYSLNPDHDGDGKDKARVFESVLGFTRLNMDDLAEQLVFNLEEAEPRGRNDYGLLYRQIIRVNGANGRTRNVVTGWIIRDDDKTIRLTTAYVEKN